MIILQSRRRIHFVCLYAFKEGIYSSGDNDRNFIYTAFLNNVLMPKTSSPRFNVLKGVAIQEHINIL
jgi:hypothetical protein